MKRVGAAIAGDSFNLGEFDVGVLQPKRPHKVTVDAHKTVDLLTGSSDKGATVSNKVSGSPDTQLDKGGTTSPYATTPQQPLTPFTLTPQEERSLTPNYPPIQQSNNDYITHLKSVENSARAGFKGGKFYPIPSGEGKGLNPTGQEIGYGLVIQPEWLESDPDSWLEVDGVSIDIRKGITEQQATRAIAQMVDDKQQELESAVPHWGSLQEPLQMFWTDFAFNAGSGAIQGDPKKPNDMYKSLEAGKGHSVDAMIDTFNYWNSGGVATRGLLTRRLDQYNKVAEQVGLPKAVSYSWGKGQADIKFESPLTLGVKKYQGRDTVTFKARNMKETNSTSYKI